MPHATAGADWLDCEGRLEAPLAAINAFMNSNESYLAVRDRCGGLFRAHARVTASALQSHVNTCMRQLVVVGAVCF